jgi:hypothetical protein
MIYNEGFVEFAGGKHPTLMGKSPVTEYAEVWAMFVDIVGRGRDTGQATRHENIQLFLRRNQYLEECYVTYTFVPLIGPDKTVTGFYHTAVETTSQVLSSRRTQTLLAIGDAVTASRSLVDYWENLLGALGTNNHDMPWVLAYSFSQTGGDDDSESDTDSNSSTPGRVTKTCSLAGATGKPVGQVPLSFDRRDHDDPFVKIISKAIKLGETIVLRRSDPDLPLWIFDMELEHEPNSSESCRSALLIPIRPTSRKDVEGGNVIGFLVVGLAASREYDNDYEQFAHLCSRQLATSAASIMLLEQEIRRQEQLAEQLSISARQTQELEVKLSRFADISNIGMYVFMILVLLHVLWLLFTYFNRTIFQVDLIRRGRASVC